jgi:hypothetical protein
MQQAAGQHAQLGRPRRRRAHEGVEAPAGQAAAVRRAAQRAQARVVAGAAVVERGAGHVADPPAGGLHARLPLLLVAVELARSSKAPARSTALRRTVMLAPHAWSQSRSAGRGRGR